MSDSLIGLLKPSFHYQSVEIEEQHEGHESLEEESHESWCSNIRDEAVSTISVASEDKTGITCEVHSVHSSIMELVIPVQLHVSCVQTLNEPILRTNSKVESFKTEAEIGTEVFSHFDSI